MADLFPPTIDDEIACVDRELRMREAVYPRRVMAGVLTQRKADREIQVMRSVLHRLKAILLAQGRVAL